MTRAERAVSDRQSRVLVVDDDDTVREVLRRYLTRDGHQVLEAADGITGLNLVRSEQPDLLVLDLMLPGMDGLEVCREIRRTSTIPVIMLTALGQESDRVVGLEYGADDYVVKPFSPRELALRVGRVLERSRGSLSAAEQGASAAGGQCRRRTVDRPGVPDRPVARRGADVDQPGVRPAALPAAAPRPGLRPGRDDGDGSGAGRSATSRRSPCMCAGCGRRSNPTPPGRPGSSRCGESATGSTPESQPGPNAARGLGATPDPSTVPPPGADGTKS